MKYPLAIFDFDGTLADSFPFFLSVFNQLADRHGFNNLTPEEIEPLRGADARQVMRTVGMPAWKLPVVAANFIRLMGENRASVPLFEGVAEVLRDLAGHGVELAVVSSNSHENVSHVLGAETARLIRHYECGVSIFGKRSRLRSVLAKSGVPAASAIYVGDQKTDLEAAREAGIAFGAVAWGYASLDSLAARAPEEVFRAVPELLRIAR